MKLTAEQQYLNILRELMSDGIWVENKRTQSRCKTLIDRTIRFNIDDDVFPVLTTKKTLFKAAIGEMIGYLRGYTNIKDFHKLGVKTWDANANNPVWKENINWSGEGDMGLIYGAVGNRIPKIEKYGRRGKLAIDGTVFWLSDIIEKIERHEDDRGLIWNFWNPGMFHLGCLRPCVYNHQFSILDGKLHLSSIARSQDMPLGTPFNLIQVAFLLWVFARLSDLKTGDINYHMINVHFYENQTEGIIEQLSREPFEPPRLKCNKEITVESLLGFHENEEDNLHPDDFELVGYQHHPFIKFPFTV